MKAFISYSHRDEAALDRLHTHLAMLRREGNLQEWYDREILAGGDIDREITEELESADLFLPLVSPDFLGSNYCYETEMERAIARHDSGDLRIVPIIVEPCDWKASPLQKFKATPKDGTPISNWTNQNNAYLDVVTELRRLIAKNERTAGADAVAQDAPSSPRSEERSGYRVRRDFDEIDRADFREVAFKEMREFFQNSITELDQIEGLRGRFYDVDAITFRCTVVNHMRHTSGSSHITVRTSADKGFGDISYSFSENASENSANGWFTVASDDYDLFLDHQAFTRPEDDHMSPRHAAEILWTEFLGHAGVDYD